MNAKGIDVSAFNGDLGHILPQLDFVIARASIGATADGRYKQHAAQTLAAGKVLGCYHFATSNYGGVRQAKALLANAGKAAFLVVDDEGVTLTHPEVVHSIIVNLHTLDPQKRHVLLYASEGNWPGDLGQDGNWVANWGHAPERPWRFWQNKGSPLDHDQYHGTVAQLRAWAATRR